ncbi:MAG TPA: hypothetical protein VFO55_01945 [Gemmatimonadaceae bacterium]|nr:hypothetical protein [Gemmatimonadaceae bacterium]
MSRRTTLLAVSLAAAAAFAEARGQSESRPRSEGMRAAPVAGTAKRPARTATIPASPAAQPIVVNTTGVPMTHAGAVVVPNTTGLPIPNSTGLHTNFIPPAAVAQVSYYPTVVLTDGRVLANFGTGRGYEQVLRKCAVFSGAAPYGAYVSPCWTTDAYGRYVVIQQR